MIIFFLLCLLNYLYIWGLGYLIGTTLTHVLGTQTAILVMIIWLLYLVSRDDSTSKKS